MSQVSSIGYYSILAVSYFLLSGALDSSALHLSYPTITSLASHTTNILIPLSLKHLKTSVLELKSLKKLYLCNDGLSGEAGEQLAEILLGGEYMSI